MYAGIAILAIGFLLGMRHATDPDHVVAVSTIVSRERSILKAGLIGILWGIGHTITILVVGAGIILFGLAIPVRVGLAMELSVGLMLVLLGVLNLTGTLQRITTRLSNALSSAAEGNACFPADDRASRGPQSLTHLGWFHTLRPLAIGIVHGLAGSAAVALLVLGAIRNPSWAVGYLLVFGIGTVVGMMLITAAIALPFSFAGYKFAGLNRGLIAASGLLSLSFGLFICYQIGFVDGLFTSHPNWVPH
jgi:high-affinity nickel-transport protein